MMSYRSMNSSKSMRIFSAVSSLTLATCRVGSKGVYLGTGAGVSAGARGVSAKLAASILEVRSCSELTKSVESIVSSVCLVRGRV